MTEPDIVPGLDEFQTAARLYCKQKNADPDERISLATASRESGLNVIGPRWKEAAAILREHYLRDWCLHRGGWHLCKARAEALEEAAQCMEQAGAIPARQCAAAIRALKEKP